MTINKFIDYFDKKEKTLDINKKYYIELASGDKLIRCKFLDLDSGLLIQNYDEKESSHELKIDLSEIKHIAEVGERAKPKEYWNNEAVKLMEKGSYTDALNYLEESLKMDAHFYPALVNKGIILCEQKKLEEAKQIFEHASKLEPINASAFEGIGCVLSLLGQSKEAINYYEKALSINPNFRTRVNREKVACQINRQKLESSLSQS